MRWGGEAHAGLADLCVRHDVTLFDALRVIDRGAESIAFVCAHNDVVRLTQRLGEVEDGGATARWSESQPLSIDSTNAPYEEGSLPRPPPVLLLKSDSRPRHSAGYVFEDPIKLTANH